MNITDHMKLSQSDRQRHIDLTTPCYGHVIEKGKNKGQLSGDSKKAKNSLLVYHNIEDFKSHKIHTCHLCPNDSSSPSGFICINPNHLYFGTSSENMLDIPETIRTGKLPASDKQKKAMSEIGKRTGKINGKLPASEKVKKAMSETGKLNGSKNSNKLIKEGRHISQKSVSCPHCGKIGNQRVMKRWHFDNCKHK